PACTARPPISAPTSTSEASSHATARAAPAAATGPQATPPEAVEHVRVYAHLRPQVDRDAGDARRDRDGEIAHAQRVGPSVNPPGSSTGPSLPSASPLLPSASPLLP